jgi:hypothetical protein
MMPPPPPVQEMKLPQLETPKPKNKMKTFNWTKLPVNKIFGKNNIWTKVAKTFEKEKATPIGELLPTGWVLGQLNLQTNDCI